MKLILGGAQFADKYGISNNKSHISKKDLKKIFELSANKSNFIDTAFNYKGSLETIAKYNHQYDFKINLKIDVGKTKLYQSKFFERVNYSFAKLNKNKIYCIMIHDTINFMKLKPSKKREIIDGLNLLKKTNRIKKIGYSIYDIKELNYLKNIKNIDLVQLPINIFDQHLIKEKRLLFLKKRNIEIHARSIFLQGLIFLKLPTIEKIVGKKSSQFRAFFKEYDNIEERLFHCVNFIKNCKMIDKAIVGFTNYSEFKLLLKIFKKKIINKNYTIFSIKDKKILRPYLWKIKKIYK
mgnify:CR=1 FL=1